MGRISTSFATAFRDYSMEGVAASGAHLPRKSEVRLIGQEIEAALLGLAVGNAVSVAKATKADLDADIAHPADTLAVVYNDVLPQNNDLYVKIAGSGSGGWQPTSLLRPDLYGQIALTAELSADIEGELAFDAGKLAVVYADPDPTLNGIYVKLAGSGSGGWEKTSFFRPEVPRTVVLAAGTFAEIENELFYMENELALVYADPIKTRNGIYRKVSGSGSGGWEPTFFSISQAVVQEDQVFLPDQDDFPGSLAVGTGQRSLAGGGLLQGGWLNFTAGIGAGDNMTSARYNVCVGSDAGHNMTGIDVVTTFSPGANLGNHGNVLVGLSAGAGCNGALDNTFIGTQAGLNCTTGMDNAGGGVNVLQSIGGGSENAFWGHAGGRAIVGWGVWGADAYDFAAGNGHRNTGCGDIAGRLLVSSGAEKTGGRANTYLGARTRSLDHDTANETVIGYAADGRGTNTFSFGDVNVVGHYFNAGALFIVEDPDTAEQAGNLYRDPATGELKEGTGPVYANWVPAYTAYAGVFDTVTTNAARFTRHGDIVHMSVDFTIADAGTANGFPIVSLPVIAAHTTSLTAFRVSGDQQISAVCDNAGGYDGALSYLFIGDQNAAGNNISTGRRFIVSGTYEAA